MEDPYDPDDDDDLVSDEADNCPGDKNNDQREGGGVRGLCNQFMIPSIRKFTSSVNEAPPSSLLYTEYPVVVA